MNPDAEIVFPLDMGVVGRTAQSKKSFNIPDVKQVSVFNSECYASTTLLHILNMKSNTHVLFRLTAPNNIQCPSTDSKLIAIC